MLRRSPKSMSSKNNSQYVKNDEKVESKLSKIQNDIELLEKGIRLVDTDRRKTCENNKSSIKNNTQDIKLLRMEVEELQVRITRQQQAEEKLIQEVLKQSLKDTESMKGRSGMDLLQFLETRTLELSSKCQALSHRLELLKRTYSENQAMLQEMIETCRSDDLPTEFDCQQHIRDLEGELQKIIKNNEECESTKHKLKAMVDLLRKKQVSQYVILMELKEKRKMKDIDDDTRGKEKEKQVSQYRALMDLKEKRKMKDIGNNTRGKDKEECDTISDANPSEIQELESLEREFTCMKEITGSYHYNEIEDRFLEQRSMHEDLVELKKKAEKRLQKLKEEKRDLASKMAVMKGADYGYPKKTNDLLLAKSRLQEQENRLEAVKSELDRLNAVKAAAGESMRKIIHKLQPKFKTEERTADTSIGHLASALENIVRKKFPRNLTYTANVKKIR